MKKIFNMLFIFSILAGCGLFCGCWTCKTTYEYIPQEIKDYSLFKEGSYWIYQDSVTNSIDSVVLEQSVIEYDSPPPGESCELEEYYKGKYCHHLSDTSIVLDNWINPHISFAGFPVIAFKYNDSNKYEILTMSLFNQYSIIEYWIGENIFQDVCVSEYSVFKSYWAKHIGLIRYEIYNENNEIMNTYNLIRYNVEQ